MTEYASALGALLDAGVRLVVVGAFGVNLHAGPAGPVVLTPDCDLLLPPDADGLARAIATLRHLGYRIEAGGEPLPDEDPLVIHGIVRNRACVRATRDDVAFDLPLQIAGGSFDDLWANHRIYRIKGVEVPVAALDDLLRSKELADRPKDRLFLETYRAELEALLRQDVVRGEVDDVEIDEPGPGDDDRQGPEPPTAGSRPGG